MGVANGWLMLGGERSREGPRWSSERDGVDATGTPPCSFIMPRVLKGSSLNAIQACETDGTSACCAGFASQEGKTHTPGALNGAGVVEKTAAQSFDQLSRLCQRHKIIKNYSPTVLSELNSLSRMPKEFDINIIIDHIMTVTWRFSHRRTMTGMWLKREMSEELGVDLARYLLQTAGSVVDDRAWLIAVGVQPGSVLTLNPPEADTDSSPSIKASEDYLRFCREQDSKYAMMLEGLQAYCEVHDTTPKRVAQRFCIIELKHDHDLDQLGEVVDLHQLD